MKTHTPHPIPHTLALCLLFLIGCAEIPDELRDEAAGKTFNYCVLDEQKMCLTGTFTHKDCSGKANNSCPYGSPKGCSESVFNSSMSFCYDGNIYQKCDGMEYNPTTHICQGNSANPAKCGGTQYNPLEQRCQSNILETKCEGGNNYHNSQTQFCFGDNVYDKCNGQSYNPTNQRCGTYNIIETRCGTGSYYYDTSTKFCNGNNVYDKCDWEEYNPSNQRCRNNVIETKCGTGWYNLANQRCGSNSIIETRCGTNLWYDVKTLQYCSNGAIKTYKTVTIGNQTWMAENLKYNVPGSECYEFSLSFAEIQANCDKYGDLYDWSTAMDIDMKYNGELLWNGSDIKHQGICPSGWHIPNNTEWTTLVNYVEGDNGCSNCAGTHLKATSGWNSYSGIENLDTYSFSALPGGGYWGGHHYEGNTGLWRSSTEYTEGNYSFYGDMFWSMDYQRESVGQGSGCGKSCLMSVRCVKD
jgi:uncharacterized protein (TIGR02145 family)